MGLVFIGPHPWPNFMAEKNMYKKLPIYEQSNTKMITGNKGAL
jgi:hypothetical protein